MGWFPCGVLCVSGRVIQQEIGVNLSWFQGLSELLFALPLRLFFNGLSLTWLDCCTLACGCVVFLWHVSGACFLCSDFILCLWSQHVVCELSVLCYRIRSEQRKCQSGWTPFRRWRRASLCWLSFCRTTTAPQAIRAMLNSYRWTDWQIDKCLVCSQLYHSEFFV